MRPDAPADLGAVGRAQRRRAATLEVWSFAPGDGALAAKLVTFGDAGAGGFVSSAEDEAGLYAVRRSPTQTLDGLPRGARLDGPSALAKVRDLARALAFCESRAVFPGPLRPADVALGSVGRPDAFLLLEGWVRALLGEPASATTTAPSPRWTPPEQVAGAPWDNAGNRYVLGLVAYRLVAGAHPFSGMGLRDAMTAQVGAPPPFEEAIARELRPGMQSFVLALLDPEPSRRPAAAAAIVARCEELLRHAPLVRAPRVTAVPVAETVAAPATITTRRRSWLPIVPIAIGLAFAGAGLATARPVVAPATVVHATVRPLTQTTAETCAPCHARQVAEWQRSVMAHAAKSPLFGALESAVEEQVGRDDRCPGGAGVLRRAGGDVCRDAKTGLPITGTGGEHWCVNCHAAGDNAGASAVPPWSTTQKPLRDLLPAAAQEGISCAVCHETIGPVHATGYQGNPTWTSPFSGNVFPSRPEDASGQRGIANSGYLLDPGVFLATALGTGPRVHRRPPAETTRYLRSSEFCGACHDVRLFGTDAVGVKDRGDHFKRLRNAYSEWKSWSDAERVAGRSAATCQDCHMSLYPGVCVPGAGALAAEGCPTGTRFEARRPGEKARGMVAATSAPSAVTSHWFSSVDLPLADEFPDAWATTTALDDSGVPIGLEARRLQLLRHTFRFAVAVERSGNTLTVPIEIENVGAGHRVPAGFSQERETWVELTVRDGRGDVVYEVGKLASDDADLRDKVFLRVGIGEDTRDGKGRPLGVFGADVVDGPDHPRWSPNPTFGGTTFRGQGLVNLQNGFLRCVKCIGVVDADGRCEAGAGQGRTRADRFDDGAYDLDTGECRSNLTATNAFLETFFPVGALDADRGVVKAPDAILDQRSAAPGVTLRYVYELDTTGRTGPFRAEARLRFRPFPPFLLRTFADYEARKAAEGKRPSGAQVTTKMLARNHPIDLAEATAAERAR